MADFDLVGSVLLLAGMVGLLISLPLLTRQGSAPGGLAAVASVVVLVLAVRVELRHPYPVIPFRVFRVRGVFIGASQAVFIGWVTGTFLLVLPFLFVNGYGWSVAYAGGILFFLNVLRPGSNLATGWLADRLGSGKVIGPAVLLTITGQLLIASNDAPPALEMVIASLLLVGSAQAIIQTANLRQLYAFTPQELLRLAPGLNLVFNQLGSVVGQAIVASSLAIGTVASAEVRAAQLVDSASRMLVVTTVVFGIGMVVSQLAGQIPGRLFLKEAGSPNPE